MAQSATLIREISTRAGEGSMYRLALTFGVPRERLYQIRNGSSVGCRTAARILDKIREEDWALANKIEAELVNSFRDRIRYGGGDE